MFNGVNLGIYDMDYLEILRICYHKLKSTANHENCASAKKYAKMTNSFASGTSVKRNPTPNLIENGVAQNKVQKNMRIIHKLIDNKLIY
jgi:hypothetical protein